MTHAFVAAPLLAALVNAAADIGLDRARLVADAGLDEDKLADPDRIVPETAERALWAAMIAQSNDTSIGILCAQRFPRGSLRVLEYLVRTSPNLGMGLRLVNRFNRLLRSYAAHTMTDEPSGLLTVSHREYDVRSRSEVASIESGVALLVHVARDATGVELDPTEIAFRHARASADEVYALLGGNVVFDRAQTEILIDRKTLAVPMLDADATLNDILMRCAERRIAELPHAAPATMRVHEALLQLLPRREPTLDAVAAELETSTRVLQRQLQAEGITFRAVVERVREQVAKRYLAESELTTVDVAMLLDYSDAPSFHRAFRRWTGMSPGEYRRSLTE